MAADWFIADLTLIPTLPQAAGQGGAARRPLSLDGRVKPGHDQVRTHTRLYLYVCGA